MKQILLALLILSTFTKAIAFKEIKLIEALGLETFRYGEINYDKQKTIIKYKDGKTITKLGNTLTVHNKTGKLLTTINLLKKPQILLYFTLTKALFSKKFNLLKENFNIKKQNLKYIFTPKGDTAQIVNGIELLLKKDGSVVYFIIDFTNKDNIKIETL